MSVLRQTILQQVDEFKIPLWKQCINSHWLSSKQSYFIHLLEALNKDENEVDLLSLPFNDGKMDLTYSIKLKVNGGVVDILSGYNGMADMESKIVVAMREVTNEFTPRLAQALETVHQFNVTVAAAMSQLSEVMLTSRTPPTFNFKPEGIQGYFTGANPYTLVLKLDAPFTSVFTNDIAVLTEYLPTIAEVVGASKLITKYEITYSAKR